MYEIGKEINGASKCMRMQAEYVNYARPQKHGNHTDVKRLRIGNLELVRIPVDRGLKKRIV